MVKQQDTHKKSEHVSGLREKVETMLFEQVDLAPLVFFRVVFGGIMLWEVMRYFHHDWIKRYYIDPDLFFTFYGFDWVQSWPGNWMYVHFLGLGICSAFIMLGLWYRISAILFFIGFTQVFLIDQTNYLNHFYLVSLIAFIMIFVPAHRAASLDVVRRPEIQVGTGPAWYLWLLRVQVGIPYFLGGIAKINGDWLRGEPMRMWLADETDFPVIGGWLTHELAPYVFSYGGLLFDLGIVPLLLWRRTRVLAFLAAVGFHLVNDQLFSIGIFPWFMVGASALFFEPHQFIGFRRRVEQVLSKTIKYTQVSIRHSDRKRRVIVNVLAVYLCFQVLMPLRHWLYPGHVSWTEEGHNFSWHMKLRDKKGEVDVVVTDPSSGKSWVVDQRDYLMSRQRDKMPDRPDMILMFCHFLEDELRGEGYGDVQIRAVSRVSLNGRAPQSLVDSTVDLTRVERSLMPAGWIVPLAD
ncbi:MAG: vitamin K-dependent gamma-carboxylase [Candidatus Latescibacterota bacterium]